ncbi:putative DsbA family dithiol-disulfide isomerase [Nocardioides daedukensis]|uniref:Putative DsbA family dithiol-disulfide isomerase n=1 Tax=Nocardioides daedukensis TaxID=634462 RepID=A0A7Y9S0H9_9ACTN|nr:DsbA family oxidoreductase [Nocardioides daedukensis]NYG58232.1 putative DsbA family dithiol-disulfide isomerase [Nocardioides daedukensis]
MRIDVWSDVVCPWCYIGKRRLETALEGFEHSDEVEVVWHSYELDPSAPSVPSETMAEVLAKKYGGGVEGAKQMMNQVETVAAEEGLRYRLSENLRVNTVDAHRVLHLALHDGGIALQSALKEALLREHFEELRNVADHDTLVEIAVAVGLDAARVREVLDGKEFLDEVHADVAQARAYGATGVPFFVIDEKYGISGAQPAQVFSQAIEQAWNESRPTLKMVDADGEACGPDGCAI